MSDYDWHGRYRSAAAAPQHDPFATERAVQAALIQRLQEARARISASAAYYDADVSKYNEEVCYLQRRLAAFNFENPWSDCTLTHVTRTTDPVAYIDIP